jgi:hypothetical protein
MPGLMRMDIVTTTYESHCYCCQNLIDISINNYIVNQLPVKMNQSFATVYCLYQLSNAHHIDDDVRSYWVSGYSLAGVYINYRLYHRYGSVLNPEHALVRAVNDNDLVAVEYALQNGEDPNMKDQFGNSVLRLASLYDRVDMVRLLLKYGADPKREQTRISVKDAVSNNDNFEIAYLLLDAGADPNTKDTVWGTILHSAIFNENKGMVILLLAYGADPLITNNKGVNAYQFAHERGFNMTVSWLSLINYYLMLWKGS